MNLQNVITGIDFFNSIIITEHDNEKVHAYSNIHAKDLPEFIKELKVVSVDFSNKQVNVVLSN